MAIRNGHGNGAGTPRVEVLPPDEQPPAQAVVADPLTTGRDERKRIRTTAAARAMAKLPRRSRFMTRELACHEGFEPHNRRRLEWQKARLNELARAHGGSVSRGVGAIVASAAWLYAAGEFAAELAAKAGDVELFKTAASLTSTARQHELASWELAAREATARREANPAAAHAAALATFSRKPAPESDRGP
jgi:hypothetical protein